MKLGLVPMGTPPVTEMTPERLATWRELGASVIGGRLPDDLDSLELAECRRIRAMVQDSGLAFGQLWIFEVPLFHPDPARQSANEAKLRRSCALIRELGCPVLIVGGGSYSPQGAFAPDARNQTDQAVEAVARGARLVMPAAADHGVYLAVEPLCLAIVRSPQCMRQIIDAVGSPHLGVNLDPVNWMTLDTIFYMTDAVNEMFDLFGESIVAAHAKDGRLEPRVLVHLSECRCGTGQMDWRTFLRRFSQLAPATTLALEHTADADVPAAFQHLQACAQAEGLAFS
jgi:L-ribulose-5-phosphate 3-epimerase